MRTGIIIQVSDSSVRLPHKSTKKIGKRTLLEHTIDRMSQVKDVDKIIIATTLSPFDDVIETIANLHGLSCHRWQPDELLEQFYNIAYEYGLDTIIRARADEPLLDSNTTYRALREFSTYSCDYCSNLEPRTYPRGYDIEVMSFDCLEKVFLITNKSVAGKQYRYEYRHYPTVYIRLHPKEFKLHNFEFYKDYSKYRVEVDYEFDFVLVSKIIAACGEDCSIYDVVKFLDDNPNLVVIDEGLHEKVFGKEM